MGLFNQIGRPREDIVTAICKDNEIVLLYKP
jgi:hypothetical protein